MRHETPGTLTGPPRTPKVKSTDPKRETSSLSSRRRDAIRRRLLGWYERHRRDLPWRRRQGDAYAQWVAEIMLQQTRVETVLGYYERFLSRFPDARTLADADHQDLLKQWEGLGYYRRAMHLHRAARMIRDWGGAMPATSEGWRSLPGVGAYTAAAIASIAFGEPAAAVDGNVARVIARLFAIGEDARAGATRRRIDGLAKALLPPSRPGDFNQAWMDLGSSICTPKRPRCEDCPLRSTCEAFGRGIADSVPATRTKGKSTVQSFVAGVFVRGGRLLVRRRSVGGLWSGLWEFPTIETETKVARAGRRVRSRGALAERAAVSAGERRALEELLARESLSAVDDPRWVGEVPHELTHRSLRFRVCRVEVRGSEGSQGGSDRRWVTATRFGELPVSTAHRRIHAALVRSGRSACGATHGQDVGPQTTTPAR